MTEKNQVRELLLLNPVCTHNIWGGSKLREMFGYPVEGDDLGECWGISAHPEGDGTVRSGSYEGKTLSWLWAEHPELFGNLPYDRYPLLTKIIDAQDDLSIQVHPDDAYAQVHENAQWARRSAGSSVTARMTLPSSSATMPGRRKSWRKWCGKGNGRS